MNTKALVILTLIISARAEPLAADPILSGSVSFNPATSLYTYSYVVDNRLGPAGINELSILIDGSKQDFSLEPIAHVEPLGWDFATAISGSSALPPLNEFGTFWQWFDSVGVPVGATLSGFSFTTDRGPTAGLNNNFFLFSTSFSGGPPMNEGTVEFGHIVAPDFGVQAVPEPSASVLLAISVLGLIGCCWKGWNRT
jgi:hypothetical protein